MKSSGSPRRFLAWGVTASLVAAMTLPGIGTAGTATFPAGKAMQTVFVELSQPPMVEAELAASDTKAQAVAIAREHNEFRLSAKAAGIKFKERYAYTKLFNGFSLTLPAAELPALARIPGVQNIFPVVEFERPELHSSTDMIRAPEVVADGYDGTGVKVAVIDTGIDYTHPDLGGCFGVGCRVMRGYDFVGDAYTGPWDVPMPDNDPMDQEGHGTHVAGIIGARAASDEGVTGVAPGVTFFAYKVFGETGPTSADVMAAAMEQAYADRADVVNMSIGSAFQWPQYPTAVAADRLVRKGVVVAVSAGNSGTNGLFAGGAPSVGSKVLGVASFENVSMTVLRADLSDSSSTGYGIMTFAPDPAGQSFEVVAVPNLGNSDADYAGLNVVGKAALISRGADTFANKTARAQRFGAAAVIIHNNTPGFFAGTLATPTNGTNPWIYATSVSREDGLAMRSKLSSGPLQVTFTNQSKVVANPQGGQISAFSSWGPSPDLQLKPDLGAPGGMIYSTYPMHLGGYATLSGTSMAAPHTAGAAALLIQAHHRLRAEHVQDILRNTAVPQVYSNTPYLWPVNRQGAGMIDVRAAVSTPVRISPAKVSLGELETAAPQTITLTLTNMTRRDATYRLDHTAALTAYGDYPNAQTVRMALSNAVMSAAADTVTVPAGSSINVNVTIAPPEAEQGDIFGGYITFVNDDGYPALRVPYMGYMGDYQADDLLAFSAYDMPWLAKLEGTTFYRMENMVINPVNGESAYVLFNLARQASRIKLSARQTRGRVVNRIFDLRWVGRSADPAGADYLSWDGRDARGNMVPQGDYVLVLEVLRPLGDPNNPDHWDTWQSGPVTVTYR